MRRLGGLLLLGTAVAALLAIGLMTLVERLIFQPGPRPSRPVDEFGAEDVFIETEDQVRIHGYWLGAPPAADGAGPDRAILFLHGNAGDASRRLANAASLRELGNNDTRAVGGESYWQAWREFLARVAPLTSSS